MEEISSIIYKSIYLICKIIFLGDFFDQEEGSGGNFPTDDEDYRDPILVESPTIPTTRPKTTTTTTTTTTTSTTPLPVVSIFDDPYEGSGDHLIDDELEGSGGCDDEDDEDCQSKTVPTIPTINIPTSTIPKSVDQNPITIFDPTTKSSTSTSTTSTTTSTTTTTTTTATSITTERSSPTSRPSTPSTSSATPPPSTSSPPSTNNVGGSKTNHGFGPNKEKVPTVLVEHRILVVILYSAIVFCLVLGIIVSFCLLMRCRKQEQNEVSSDTASSDLPIIKADAKRYTAQIVARRTSDSPPPLPDLKLFDEAPKSDFNRSRSGGSLRKSKRDLKPPVNPNWL